MDNLKCLNCGKTPTLIATIREGVGRLPYTIACGCIRVSGTTVDEARRKWSDESGKRSPFAFNRSIIMGGGELAEQMRRLVLTLYDPQTPMDIPALFSSADSLTRNIILKLIDSHARHGMDDAAFVTLAEDIQALNKQREQGGE